MTTRRSSANVQDYPEHLNPFHEEDNHTRLRFWSVPKKKSRSNSFSFQSVKDFRGSIRFPRSRNRTDTSSSLSQLNCYGTKPKTETEQNQNHNRFFSTLRKLSRSFSIRSKNKNSSSSLDQTSQIENDEVQLRVSPTSRPPTESYSASQRLSVTPLPRSRMHERVRNYDPESEKTDSPVSTPSDEKNPFSDDTDDETKVTLRPHSPSKPITPARKKKRAPPPPPVRQSSLKAKSLLEYKASKQNEDNPSISSEDTVVSKEEIEKLNTSDIQKHVHIEIKVVEVIDVIEQKEEINAEDIVEVSTREETCEAEEIKVLTNAEIDQEVSANKETSSEQKENEEDTSKDDIPAEENEKIEETSNKENIPVSDTITNEETSSAETVPISDTTKNEICINYNSEVSLSSSHSSVSSEVKLEELLQKDAVDDTSDLLELVNKLKLEVDKLTDETNNNIVETEEERKAKNIESWIKLDSSSRVKTELNLYLDSDKNDDDDVVCSAPLSPRLVRLRKDNEWIRQQN